MKAYWLAVSAFLFSLFVVIVLPSFSLSAYWEPCGTGTPPANQCATRGVANGLTETYQCHKSAVSGSWQWDKQTLLQVGGSESIESNKIISGVCADTYDNNCNGLVDAVDTRDCMAPVSLLNSVEGDTTSPYFDSNGANSKTVVQVVVSDESDNSKIGCRWYISESGYSAGTGTACNDPTAEVVPKINCDMTQGSTEGPHTGYIACIDENINGQPYTNGVADRTSKKIDWTGDWTGPLITFDKPPSPTGVPYDIKIKLSDTYAGVDKTSVKIYVSNNGGSDIDITTSFSNSGACETGGVDCIYTRTIISGAAEATAGTHKLTVTVNDNLGTVQQTPNTYTYTVSVCTLDSVTIAPSVSCNKDINMCTVSGSACTGGNAVTVTAAYTGLNCPDTDTASFTVQVDAKTSDNLCNVQGSGGQMTGISITCSNPTPSASQQTCTGSWTLPNPIPPVCQKKTIIAKSGANDGCINGLYCTTPSGSFGACRDETLPSVSLALENGNDFKASKTISATSMSGIDNIYGLNSCALNWGDATVTSKTCDGTLGEECASKFSSADKQHTYATDSSTAGDKIATFSCTNKNSATGSAQDPITICTSMGALTGLQAYSDPSPDKTILPNGVWQKDGTPYFQWDILTSPCGVKYDISGSFSSTTTANSFIAGFADGKIVITVTPKDNNGLGLAGSSQTFNLWIDTVAPVTSIVESIPASGWFNAPFTLHLSCSDASSLCSSTQYCLTSGCTPDTTYVAGITISNTAYVNFRSTDNAGNVESTKNAAASCVSCGGYIQVDTTPPNTPTVTISGVVNGYINTPTQMTVSWTSVTDQTPNSGIMDYKYSIGEAPACTNVLGFTSAGLVTTKTVTGISLVEGKNYCANVMVVNGAGLTNTGTSSNVQLDVSGPSGINSLTIQRTYGSYISSPFTVYSAALVDSVGIDTSSCQYTIDGSSWVSATWNSASTRCEKTNIPCNDGDSKSIKMRVYDLHGSLAQTLTPLIKVCDASFPELQSFVPAAASTLTTSTKDVTFSTTARDLKSGLAKLEWTLYMNGIGISDAIQTTCDGGESVSVTCNMKVSDFKLSGVNIDPKNLKTGDRLFARVRADDHIDPWSPTGDSGQWLIDESAPGISTIAPVIANLGVQQTYSASVKAVTGKTITSCDLLVNGAKADGMVLSAGTTADGTWSGKYTINTPATTFMRAHCIDNENVIGDGVDVQVSLATQTNTGVNIPINQPPTFLAPLVSFEKLQMTNITAKYNLAGGGVITGANCWVSSSDFDDPSKGIVGISLNDLNNGYYTYSFPAPAITGNYNYLISCSKQGYQTSSGGSSFTVLGCDGLVCVKVTPKETAEVLKLGETRTLNLLLKNRDDFTRTYSISLSSADPRISVEITPVQVTLNNGEEKTVTLGLTSLLITDQLIVQNIIVKNVDPSKSADVATSAINISVAVGVVPEIGAVEVGLIFVLATLALYSKTGFRAIKRRK
ncbi:MAG: fibronectin type III domain-containing protein [Candidatus Aenigmarchaeota archaeon]|nr:fibronectin type III domain-containing protein [Candidatus Aenigmarchaeota archaeon]